MAASTATLARCLDVSTLPACMGWATKTMAAAAIASNPTADAYRMRPIRAHNKFFLFWVAATVLHTDDVRTVAAVLRTDLRDWDVATLDTPEGAALRPDAPMLSAELATRHIGRRLTIVSPTGDVRTIDVTAVTDGYVYARVVRTGHLIVRQGGVDAVLRGGEHLITYSAGSRPVIDGPRTYAFDGAPIERSGYFWSAFCSCGHWSYSDSGGEDARRHAVRAHLIDVGEAM